MAELKTKQFSWDFYSKLIILSYAVLQLIRLPVLPYFMDIYYHFLTAQGFLEAGGWSGWDFWQYAPLGRMHIYPPFFHILLAALFKLGASKVFLAKFFEAVTPLAFLWLLWYFIGKHFNRRFAFFVILAFSSSLSFFIGLSDHIPATIALIFGFLAFDQLWEKRALRPAILFSLCFYTHIGISYFFILGLFFYGLFDKEYRKACLSACLFTFLLSAPMIIKEIKSLQFISAIGLNLNERFICQIKILDYLLAFAGFYFAFKKEGKFRLFISLFFASLIFIIYPRRFFSSEGYLPIIFLAALFIYTVYEYLKDKRRYLRRLFILPVVFILFLSPTISMDRPQDKLEYKLNFADAALTRMIFVRNSGTMWFPEEYLWAVSLIRQNSRETDIVYSTMNFIGIALAGISGRPTANGLFPEIKPQAKFDPFLTSRIIVFTRLDDASLINKTVSAYSLAKLGENKFFIIYKNPFCPVTVNIRKATLPFIVIFFISLAVMILFWRAKNI